MRLGVSDGCRSIVGYVVEIVVSHNVRDTVPPVLLAYSCLMGINGVEDLIPPRGPGVETFVDYKIKSAHVQISKLPPPANPPHCTKSLDSYNEIPPT